MRNGGEHFLSAVDYTFKSFENIDSIITTEVRFRNDPSKFKVCLSIMSEMKVYENLIIHVTKGLSCVAGLEKMNP